MAPRDFSQAVDLICREDTRYAKEAYFFVRQSLDHTIKKLKPSRKQGNNHVNGQELLSGIRDYALECYGPLTHTLLTQWGVSTCEDFGNIVFNLVDYELLGKTQDDSQKDFSGGYDFREAFLVPFMPKSSRKALLVGKTEPHG